MNAKLETEKTEIYNDIRKLSTEQELRIYAITCLNRELTDIEFNAYMSVINK